MEKKKLKENSSKYYRVTYNGQGIYNALKNNIDLDTWQKFLANKNVNWLPKPSSYCSEYISYFTKKGYEEFINKTMPIISNYLTKENITIDIFDKIPGKILYTDPYQVIISKKNSS